MSFTSSMSKNFFRLSVLAVCLACGSWTCGDPVTWTAGSGTWETASNWSTGTVPTTSDDVTFTSTGTPYTVTFNNNKVSTNAARSVTIPTGVSLVNKYGDFDLKAYRFQNLTIDGGSYTHNISPRFPHSELGFSDTETRFTISSGSATFPGYASFDTGVYYLNGGNVTVNGGFFIGLSEADVSVYIQGANILSTNTVGIGARQTGYKRTVTMSSGTWTATNKDTANNNSVYGFAIGSGDQQGNGELLMTGGTLNVTQNGGGTKEAGLLVGSSLYKTGGNRGLLSISGTAVVNTKGTLHVGGTTASNDKGTVTLAGNGILRAEKVNVNDGATMNLTGGTLSASQWNGDLTLNGTTLAPETWKFNTTNAYEQTSKYGTLTVSGTLTIPESGTSVVALDVGAAERDVITAGSFNINGGTLQLNTTLASGGYVKTSYSELFQTTGTRTLNFASTDVGEGNTLVTLSDGGLLIVNSTGAIWNGGTGTWQTASGWSTGAVPTAATDVFILTGSVSTGSTNPQAKVFTVGGDATFTAAVGFKENLTKFVINGGTVNWNNTNRIIENGAGIAATDDYRFEMHGGKAYLATQWATFNAGKNLLDGGLLRVTHADGTLIFGLTGNAVTTIKGTAQIDTKKLSIGARYQTDYANRNSTVNVSENALILVRKGSGGEFTGNANGLLIGFGDNSGNGTLNQSGGTINVLTGANVYVGSSPNSRNAVGTLEISGGEMNAVGTVYVGKYSSSLTQSQTGTLTLTGTGTLRAGTIQPGVANATLNFTGGTLTVGTYKGNFVNAGTTLSPETWTFKQDSSKANTAAEWAYNQTSVFGTTVIEGTYTQNTGSVVIDLGQDKNDLIKATSFTFNGGSAQINWSGDYKAPGTDGITFQFFQPTDASATNTWLSSLTYDEELTTRYVPVYDSTTGLLTLTQRVAESNNVAGNWNETATWKSEITPNQYTDALIGQGTVTVPAGSGIVQAKTITVDGGKLVVAVNGFENAVVEKIVVNSGSVEWNSEKRVIHGTGTFEMHGGTFTTLTKHPTMNGGTFNYDGGLFRVDFSNGTVIWGLETNAATNISDTAQIDTPNIVLGGRYGGNYTTRKSTLNVSGGTTLVRGDTGNVLSGSSVGLLIGSGDQSGNGELNLTGGTISVMNGEQNSSWCGDVYVGSSKTNGVTSYTGKVINSKGALNISGGTLNASGTVYVGLHPDRAHDSTVPKQEGTLTLSSDGTLRAGTIHLGTDGSASFTGGTLTVENFEGDFLNAGATIAPETWTFAQDSTQANTALEWSYNQTSPIGTMTVLGQFAQTSGTIQLDLVPDGTSDLVLADSFDLQGGILSLDFLGDYDGSEITYKLFGTNDETAAAPIDLSKLTIQLSENLSGASYMLGPNGTFMLGASANSVPEPAAWVLLILGALGIWRVRSRK